MTDQLLINELREGSELAFDTIYKMYAKRLYAFCLQYCKRKEDAEEIVGDVFLWLWRNKHTIRQGEALKYLLFLRARHFLVNAFRSRVNSPIFADYVDYQNSISADTVSQQLEYQEFEDKIIYEVDRLPKTQQEVIRLAKMEGLKIKEIAGKLGLSEQTVKNQISIGLRTLKKKLGVSTVVLLIWLVS